MTILQDDFKDVPGEPGLKEAQLEEATPVLRIIFPLEFTIENGFKLIEIKYCFNRK